MRKVNICSIVKDEGPYISEFIEYYLLKGVTHFFIYNHGSRDKTLTILKGYEKLGIVTVIDWSRVPVPAQRKAYEHCIMINRKTSDWLGFFDCDEFAVTHNPEDSLPQVLYDLELGREDEIGVIVSNWILYGTSGFKVQYSGCVLERFIMRAKDYDQHVKTFIIPEFSSGPGGDAHTFLTEKLVINSAGREVRKSWPFHPIEINELPEIVIHHYHTKSVEEYKKRIDRGRVDTVQKKEFEENLRVHDVNDIQGENMLGFVKQIEENKGRRFWNR